MRSIILLFAILLSSAKAVATDTNTSCEWLLSKWKCSSKNSWTGIEELEFYNIVRISEFKFRVNSHPNQVPASNSYLGFDVYLDGRLNEDLRASSRCEDSKLVIDYLEDLTDENSISQSHEFVKSSNGMQFIISYYGTGEVTYSNCEKL